MENKNKDKLFELNAIQAIRALRQHRADKGLYCDALLIAIKIIQNIEMYEALVDVEGPDNAMRLFMRAMMLATDISKEGD